MEPTVKKHEISKQDYSHYIQKGIDYHQYKIHMEEDFVISEDEELKGYIKLNQSRMRRVEKTYILSEEIKKQVKNLRQKTYWLILTEHWCGDASQCLPVFNRIAEASNGMITMKLVYRDQHPELMDEYLTNGTKSIPKLIQMDKYFNVTGIWGPRPSVAQKLVKELKSNPETAPTYGNQLHSWYAKDKQKTLETEIEKLLNEANLSSSNDIL